MRAFYVFLFGVAPLALHCDYTAEHSLPGAEGDGDGAGWSISPDKIPGAVGDSPEPGGATEPADFVGA